MVASLIQMRVTYYAKRQYNQFDIASHLSDFGYSVQICLCNGGHTAYVQ